jgi:hypothetical protein
METFTATVELHLYATLIAQFLQIIRAIGPPLEQNAGTSVAYTQPGTRLLTGA